MPVSRDTRQTGAKQEFVKSRVTVGIRNIKNRIKWGFNNSDQ
jgi:hypothetical protein